MSWILAVVMSLGIEAAAQPEDPLSAADGATLEAALGQILQNIADRTAADANTSRSVVVSERAVNGYLRFQGAHLLPPAVTEPRVVMPDAGRLSVGATVNLDELREQQPRGVLDPLRYVSGQVPVTAVAAVSSADRTIRVVVESVHVGSVSMPTTVLLELVRYYTRSERYPDGIDLTDAFALPPGIDDIRIETGHAVVVQ